MQCNKKIIDGKTDKVRTKQFSGNEKRGKKEFDDVRNN